ncbi:pyridoxal phosphate-dependent aminotransferase [Gluconacetobacter sp. Hr-1-5]|uniref:pyridoxal phosphate-dependent aminotransferase n=1 Tax=Gluconacetobacter sp. Hr-1-5 TaxID=3395370 RepID=UPI003B51EB6C
MSFLAKRITHSSKKNYGMFAKAAALAAGGAELIHLELGRPVHDTPEHIKRATIDALQAGKVHYSDLQGISTLRTALAEKLRDFNGIDAAPEQILVTNGLTQASFAAFLATVEAGDEVILLEPYYPQHVGKIELAGGKVVLAPLDRANGFALNAALIEPFISSRTKAIVLVNPCNPTGRVYKREELEDLAALAIRHDLLVISDEVYDFITFDNARHISIAALPGMAERTISMYAFTKAYAMDGWRLGYAMASPELIDGMLKVTANEVTHVNTFIQEGALAAVTGDQAPLLHMVQDDQKKRDLIVSALNQMPGVTCTPPEGTIYAFPDISATGRTSQALADSILEQCGVVVEAGGFYGQLADRNLRICFGSQPRERLEEAAIRLTSFFNRL